MTTNKIVKVSPKMKTMIANAMCCRWTDIRVVVFEANGVDVYLEEYGVHKKIKYDKLK